jgi:hypothetical protein
MTLVHLICEGSCNGAQLAAAEARIAQWSTLTRPVSRAPAASGIRYLPIIETNPYQGCVYTAHREIGDRYRCARCGQLRQWGAH